MFSKLWAFALTLLSAFTSVALAQGVYTPPPVEAFGQMPFIRDLDISPSGNRFFAIVRPDNAQEYQFVVFDIEDGTVEPIYGVTQTDELSIRQPFWKRDDRIIFSVRGAGNRYGTETVETRLFSLDPEEGKMRPLFRSRPDDGVPVQIQDRIVSRLRGDSDHILISYYKDSRVNVYRVYTEKSRRHNQEMSGKRGISSWRADSNGRIRSGSGIVDDKRQRLIVRLADDKWEDISHRVAEGAPDFRFLGFPDNPDKAFVASAHESETAALYLYDIPTDSFEKQLFRSEVSDVYGVVQRAEDGAALGVIFAEDDADIHWFGDNLARRVLERVKKALPGYSITLESLNANDTHSVIFAEQGNNPGQYYLFDHDAGALVALPVQYPSLEGREMGQTFVSSYPARDGLDIPAYITLPPTYTSLEEAKDLPFIVLPHGGPNARTFAGFDWEVQFLVSRGYGVLEMNFRGSTGYGQNFREAGDREWGQAMQDDITDGANWLVEQGFADRNRLAIMGHSYGGYAALMGVVKTPDLYQCAVTHGAVADLPRLIKHEAQFVGGKYWTRRIGRLWGDREMLRENSPALHADKIKVPVLLFHGEEDRVVIVDQTERMVSGLKRQDREFKYVELEKGSHYLNVSDNRLVFLQETEAFLKECLGG